MGLFLQVKNKLWPYKGIIKTSIDIGASLATIISVIIVLLTLHEMQIQRNNAYMPDIIFETTRVNLAWGNTESLDNPYVSSNDVINPSTITIPSRNIGVGVARQITYSIDVSTFIELIDLLIVLDNEHEYVYSQNGNQFVITVDGMDIMFSAKYETEKVFLLPNAEEVFDFVIPVQYTKLLQQIYTARGAEYVSIPDIKGTISYTDVQGVKYIKPILLHIEDQYILEAVDGSGCATYQITMK